MKKPHKPRFDFINFVYGVGAAIVIGGALAKFLDFKYADELFVTGLGTEVIVFLVSSFKFKGKQPQYKWENVFPDILDTDDISGLKNAPPESYRRALELHTSLLETQRTEWEQRMGGLFKTYEGIITSAEKINRELMQSAEMGQEYNLQMSELKQNLAEMNRFFNDFNEVMVYRNPQTYPPKEPHG